jgi:HK97 family phage major capsid protein
MNIEKRRAEIAARKAEIRKLIEGDTENKLNMDDVEKELRELNEEDEKLEKRQAIERMLNGGAAPASPTGLANPVARSANQPAPENSDVLYRSAWLKTLQGKPLTDDEKRAYSTASGSGLPIIPETTANQIIKKMYEVAPILQRCKIFHVPGNFKFAIEGTNDEAALHTENAAITAASDSLGSVSLTGYEIVKLVKASRACSEMALSAFESYIVEVIAESVARRIEKYIFTGTGSNQPGGVKTAGKGKGGAYTDDTDQITVAKTVSLTEANVIALYGLLGDGYERNAVWCMNKATFFSDFFPLMNKSKNNVIEFANGKYYIMGAEVYFTGSLAAHEAYLGDFSYIIGNYSQDITVVRSEHSGLATNSIDYLGACVFDSKPVAGFGAFVHLAKAMD